MEDSKSVISKGTRDEPEESGWTSYFEDFLTNQREENQNSSFSDSFYIPSLVSDAASCAPSRIQNYNQVTTCSPITDGPQMMPTKLSFKKARIKEIFHDDSLEDTASSPVNSSKVSSLTQMDINPRKREDKGNEISYLGKGGDSDCCSEIHTEAKNEITFEESNNGCTELNKRGLCLVPLSMLLNSLG